MGSCCFLRGQRGRSPPLAEACSLPRERTTRGGIRPRSGPSPPWPPSCNLGTDNGPIARRAIGPVSPSCNLGTDSVYSQKMFFRTILEKKDVTNSFITLYDGPPLSYSFLDLCGFYMSVCSKKMVFDKESVMKKYKRDSTIK